MADGPPPVVRLLDPSEAALLTELVRRCYGETYIDPTFYDEAAVRELLSTGKLRSIGAVLPSGALAGHMGITARPWGGTTADAGMTLVDPAYRGRGIARRVAVGLAEQAVAMGLVGVHDYPVTVHAATQRLAKGYGANTGLMLSNMPADVSFESMDTQTGPDRSSSIIRWLPFGRPPTRRVYVPARYRKLLESLYSDAKLERVLEDSDEPTLEVGTLEVKHDERRRIARLALPSIGSDSADRVAAETHEAAVRGALVSHVDVPLGSPAAPRVVERLRASGYSFAGLLPEYRDGDVLRLQWLSPEAAESAPAVISSDSTRAIVAFVLKDRADLPDHAS